jgi:hypothetical protein
MRRASYSSQAISLMASHWIYFCERHRHRSFALSIKARGSGRIKPEQDRSWDPETPRPPYRYGDTSVSPGSTKSGGFSCPKCHAVNLVSLAHSWGGSRVSGFEALNRH